jgi:type I restriction enzyme S subunit
VDSECTGSTPLTRNRFKENFFLNLEIQLPPLEEQRRIVAKINQLASKVEEARDLHERAQWETEALLSLEISHLFSKGREKGWTVGRLGDYVIDDCYGTSEKTTDDISGTPILRMGNIQNGRLDLRDLKYLHLNAKDRTRLLLGKGDIVVNRTNSAELVGKCAVFDLEGEYAFASYLIRLRLDKKRVEPRLVALYINSPTGRAYMFNERKQMTGQANVNAQKLKALPIVLPPLPQQHDIVAYLDDLQKKMGELQQLQAHAGAELNALLPSILDKAFKGEL